MRTRLSRTDRAFAIFFSLLCVLLLGQWLGAGPLLAALGRGRDTTALCASNLKSLGTAMGEYAQDYDEKLPLAQTTQALQAQLLPYLSTSSVFRCPDTGLPYLFNLANPGQSLASLGTTDTIQVAQDAKPHEDELTAIAYLDGHVERGGVEYGNPISVTADRALLLERAMRVYAQDNDTLLPPMTSTMAFQTAVMPYAGSQRVFFTTNNQPFVPNAALDGASILTINNSDTTPYFQDTPPYVGGLATVGYADGHVEHGGVEYNPGGPVAITSGRARQLGNALQEYIQDYDETFPPMTDTTAFQTELLPYTRSHRVFSTTNGQPFVPNAALSEISLAAITDPASTVAFQDTPPYVGGAPTTGYADGHTSHYSDVWVPSGLTPVADGTSRLLWQLTSSSGPPGPQLGRYVIWKLDANGNYVSTSTRLGPYYFWVVNRLEPDKGDTGLSLLWENTFNATASTSGIQYVIWKLDDTGNFVRSSPTFVPAPGWSVDALLPQANGSFLLAWVNTDGAEVLWKLDAHYNFLGASPTLTPAAGWQADGLVQSADRSLHLFWSGFDPLTLLPNGQSVLWNLDSSGGLGSSAPVSQQPAGWTTYAPLPKPDGTLLQFWSVFDPQTPAGQYVFWKLDANGTFISSPAPLLKPAGWTNYGPTTNPVDGTLRLFWSSVDASGYATGQSVLWNLDASGKFVNSSPPLIPNAGWTTDGLVGRLTDKTGQLLWTVQDSNGVATGHYVIWNLDANGKFVSTSQNFAGPP